MTRTLSRLAAGALALLPAGVLGAPCAPQLCPAGTGPCRVETSCETATNARVDLGERDLVIGRGVILTVSRSVLLAAGNVTLEPGAVVRAPDFKARGGGDVAIRAKSRILVQSDAGQSATIDVTGDFIGGYVSFEAGGDILIDGRVAADASRFGYSGQVMLVSTAGSIVVGERAHLAARANNEPAIGGGMFFTAADAITIDGGLDVRGEEGGEFEFHAGGDITLSPSGSLDMRATQATQPGFGGLADLFSEKGDITLAGEINAPAFGNREFAGDGGELFVVALAGDVNLLGSIDLHAPGPDGRAGTVDVQAGGAVTQTGFIRLSGKGREGCGGEYDLDAMGPITLGSADLRSGDCFAARVDVRSAVAIVLPSSAKINADAVVGDGGELFLDAPSIAVNGTYTGVGRKNGFGGFVMLGGCEVAVPPGARIWVGGDEVGGIVEIDARDMLTLGGSVRAPGEGGETVLIHGFQPGPVVPAGTFVPLPRIFYNPSLPPCGPPGTSTTTTTSTTVSTTTMPAAGAGGVTPPSDVLAPECLPATLAACDDGDPCTPDRCVGGRCLHDRLAGVEGAVCRLDVVQAMVRAAGSTSGAGSRTRARLARRIADAARVVRRLQDRRGAGAMRRLRHAERVLSHVARAIGRSAAIPAGQRRSIAEAAAEARLAFVPLESLVR